MKIGISTFSLLDAIKSGEMDVLDVVQWVYDNGGKHLEFVPYGYSLVDNPELADQVRDKADELGIELSNYCMPADFVQDTEEAFNAEVERIKEHVDIVNRMGMKHIRHDVFKFTVPPEKRTIKYFEDNLPQVVKGTQLIADYAAQYGITTTLENHGMAAQHSDRVQRVVQQVNRDNFHATLDTGNFLCVDEDPVVGVKKNIPYATMVHFKDFYIRPEEADPGEGAWITTANDNLIRGSIFGQGDIDTRKIVKIVKNAGFDGYASIEFEGMEECKMATRIGMDNLKRYWNEA